MPAHIAERVTIASPPARREDVAIKLCLSVIDIDSARTVAAELGGQLNAPENEWVFQETRVCDGFDPEGNIIQVRAHRR